MFSLIISIISIALVVALVAATMYQGGSALSEGRTKADAAGVVAGAQQVAGAQVMHMNQEGTEAETVQDLIEANFLSGAPVVKGSALTIAPLTGDNLVTSDIETDEVCVKINEAAGFDATAAKAVTATLADDVTFACVNDTAGTRAFQFKY